MISEAPDKYNRYYFTTQTIRALMSAGLKNPIILDLGSNENLLTSFLNDYPVIQADINRTKARGPLVQCRGEALPFSSKSFDIVVCLDVLEHLDEHSRAAMLQEISRVTSHTTIIAFPVKHQFSAVHEQSLSDIHSYLYGKPNRFLDEHSAFSGVNSDDVEQKLKTSFEYTQKSYIFPNNIWLLSSLIDYFLGILTEAQPIRDQMFALINSMPTFCRNEKDSYRTFIVAGHFPLPDITDLHLTLPETEQIPGNIVDAFKNSHITLKNLADYAATLESAVKKLEMELKQSKITETKLTDKAHELLSNLKEKHQEINGFQYEYNKLEQHYFHLQNTLMEKDRMILSLQEKCMNILDKSLRRKT